jgi:protein-S-isoprenylcysteine O-methyltransferase Ste14
VIMSAYILIGIHFEERDLASKHGQAYRDYQAQVPKLLPIPTAEGPRPTRIYSKYKELPMK